MEFIKTDRENLIIAGTAVNKKKAVTVILTIYVLIFILQSVYVISKDADYNGADLHFSLSILWSEYLDGYDRQIKPNEFEFPPMIYLNSHTAYKIFGISFKSARASLLIFSVIFLLSCYGAGKELGGETGGLAVTTLAASSSHIILLSRQFLPDFPVTALSALAFYLLLKTRSFRDRKYSILFGLVLFLAFMTKWAAAFFLIVPCLYFFIPVFFSSKRAFAVFAALTGIALFTARQLTTLISNWSSPGSGWFSLYLKLFLIPFGAALIILIILDKKWKKDENYRESGAYRMVNLSFGSIIFLLLTSPWYLFLSERLSLKFGRDVSEYRSYAENFDFLISLIKTSYYMAIPLIITGFIITLAVKTKRYERLSVSVSLILTTALLIRIVLTEVRYALFLVFLTALLGGFWIGYLKKWRFALLALFSAVFLFSVLAPFWLPAGTDGFNYTLHRRHLVDKSSIFTYHLPPPPKQDLYDLSEVLSKIEKDPQNRLKGIVVLCFAGGELAPFREEYIEEKASRMGIRIHPRFFPYEGGHYVTPDQVISDPNVKRFLDKNNELLIISNYGDEKELLNEWKDFYGNSLEKSFSKRIGNGYTGIYLKLKQL